jgi:hypothetical protein
MICRIVLIPWSWVIPDKPTVAQPLKKFPTLYGTQRFITLFTKSRQKPLSLTIWRYLRVYTHTVSLRPILSLSSHTSLGLSTGLFHSHLPIKILFVLFYHALPILCSFAWSFYLYLEIVQVMKLLIKQFLQPPIISSFFWPNILLSLLFSKTFSLCSSLNIRDQILYTYKIIVLYILIFTY